LHNATARRDELLEYLVIAAIMYHKNNVKSRIQVDSATALNKRPDSSNTLALCKSFTYLLTYLYIAANSFDVT